MAEKLRSASASERPSLREEEQALMRRIVEASAFAVRADSGSGDPGPSAIGRQLTITQAEISGRLHIALKNAASRSAGSMEVLRIAVSEFTVALRNEGTTPEAVLINLKAVISADALAPVWQVSRWSGPRLRDSISTWCIEEYFKEKTA